MRMLLLVLAACSTAPSKPAIPHRTGDIHDFDYFEGGWMTKQRLLGKDGTWSEFPATLCASKHLGGMVSIDEIVFPTKGWSGLTVRSFDKATKQWSVYWVDSKTGEMGPPIIGGFDGANGEFYGNENDKLTRYHWSKADADHARWEQATTEDGTAWETNWTADFVRADAMTVCDRGQPRT